MRKEEKQSGGTKDNVQLSFWNNISLPEHNCTHESLENHSYEGTMA